MLHRIAVAAALLIASGYCAYRYAYIPFICNRQKVRVMALTQRAVAEGTPYRAVVIARRNLEHLAYCHQHLPGDIDLSMLVAANYQVLQRWDDAAEEYRRALQWDRRPEIYFNLGYVLARGGRRDEAVEAYTRAVVFAYSYVEEIEDFAIREEVREKMMQRESSIRARLP